MSDKICLVMPAIPGHRKLHDLCEPFNLLFLGTYLKNNGCQVKIIDDFLDEDVVGEVEKFKPDLVGFTAMTTTYPRAVELMKKVKTKGFLTVIGGVHASARPQDALRDGFDMAVVGAGEKTLRDILKNNFSRGIFHSSEDSLSINEDWPVLDRTLINMEPYCCSPKKASRGRGAKLRSYKILTSMGCPFRCVFCHNSLSKKPGRFMKPEMIVDEIERLMADFQIEYFIFSDDDFFFSRPRMIEFFKLLEKKRLNIKWDALANTQSLDEELIVLAVKSGCQGLAFGLESGSQKILDNLNKQTDLKRNLEITDLCRKYDLEYTALLTIGNPGETLADLLLTWQFIRRIEPDYLRLLVLTAYPGTVLWQQCANQGLIPENIDFSNFSYSRTPIQIPGTFFPKKVEWLRFWLLVRAYLFVPRLRRKLLRYLFDHPGELLSDFFRNNPFMGKYTSGN